MSDSRPAVPTQRDFPLIPAQEVGMILINGSMGHVTLAGRERGTARWKNIEPGGFFPKWTL
jgi:hypothetical protein